MKNPQHGVIIQYNSKWYFRPGKKNTNKWILLNDFESNALKLIETYQLFQGHPRFKHVKQLRAPHLISTIFARHVSAVGLTSSQLPTLIKQREFNPNNKRIWESAYDEEYDGLVGLPAWYSISEAKFQKIKHKCKGVLPSMALSTIKYDEYNKPKRAKYRIVALGNLDPVNWSKSDCYAPVMSLLELRLLKAKATRHNRTLKSGEVKQTFVQANLPDNEMYVIRPPAGCPRSPKNSYWLLQRSLYGLRRAPRHWYNKFHSMLESCNLVPCTHAPCVFTGTIIEGRPPLYLGMYVDNFVYFSEDPEVEKAFE